MEGSLSLSVKSCLLLLSTKFDTWTCERTTYILSMLSFEHCLLTYRDHLVFEYYISIVALQLNHSFFRGGGSPA